MVKRAFRSLLVPGTFVAALAVAELALRACLFSDAVSCTSLRDPDLYTWRYAVGHRIVRSDDHAKLSVRWGLAPVGRDHPHALLGWCGALDSLTLMPRGLAVDTGRTPVVLLGSGWTHHGITGRLVADSSLWGSHQPIVLSVDGFSLDQDLLLLERTRPLLPGAHVFLWVRIDELDHLHRSFIDRPKPWYTPDVHMGALHGVPLHADPMGHLADHPADPGLYLYHLFRSGVLNDTVLSASATASRERHLRTLAQKLLLPGLHAAERAGQRITVLLEQDTRGELADRRRWAVREAVAAVPGGRIMAVRTAPHDAPEHVRSAVLLRRSYATEADSLRNLLDRDPAGLSPVEKEMRTILGDPAWLQQVRDKALANGTSLAAMLERDARFMLEQRSRP
jgi:hypothetical protein